MLRIVGIMLAIFLVCFSWLYTNATPEQQARVPAPVRHTADNIVKSLAAGKNSDLGKRLNTFLRDVVVTIKGQSDETLDDEFDGLSAEYEILVSNDFTAKLLGGARLNGSTLDGANFTKTYLDKALLNNTRLVGAKMDQTILSNASLQEADLSETTITGADFTQSKAQGANFNGARIEGTLMSSAQFSGASFSGSHIEGSYGDNSIFYAAIFDGARIQNTDFSKAVLDRSRFELAQLHDVNFTGASLAETDFSATDLSNTIGLTQAQLDTACGDELTIPPQGLKILTCGQLAEKKRLEREAMAGTTEATRELR